MTPENALAALRSELEGTSAYEDYVVPLERQQARVAQLEKVAELARAIPPSAAITSEAVSDAVLLVELALTDLDNHPETRTGR